MKASIAITMIVCGTVLVAVPYVHNAVAIEQVTSTMTALNKAVNVTADMPKYADSVCIFGGIIMILAGAIAGLCCKQLTNKNQPNKAE